MITSPKRAMVAGGSGVGFGVLLTWLAGQFGVDIPVEASAAITTIIGYIAGVFSHDRSVSTD